jgi:tetratricopeptide (TPR) repeat protein
MRYFVVGIVLFFAVLVLHAQTAVERADEAYRLRDYQTAITLYEEAISTGQSDGSTFYNLGNAYYEAGVLGQAMLNYRRAFLYLPRDTDLNINIARIRAERATLTTGEIDWLHQLATVTNDTFALFELSLLTFTGWVMFFGMLAIAIVRGASANYRIFLAIVGIGLLAGIVLMGSRAYVETQRPSAVILSDSVTVMSGPGADYLTLYTIHAAAEVRIMQEAANGWVRFALPDGRGGWIQKQYLGLVIEQ